MFILNYINENSPIILFFIMLFMHIIDDYYSQGILASMKQKSWWEKQDNYSNMYKDDYKIALLMHSFSWAFTTHLIFIILQANINFVIITIIVNTIIHLIVDDLKANKKKINLVVDQLIHIGQLWITACLYI